MREVIAFLMWLFSFCTWKTFFLSWVKAPPSDPGNREIRGVEQLHSSEERHESELATFLSSIPEGGRRCTRLSVSDNTVVMYFGSQSSERQFRADMRTGYAEFVAAVASSKVKCCESFDIDLWGNDSLKHIEGIVEALLQSNNKVKELTVLTYDCKFAMGMAKCVSNVVIAVLEKNGIQELHLHFGISDVMGKEGAEEFMAIVLPPDIQILKSFEMTASKLDGEGMEQVIKPFMGPHSALEYLHFLCKLSNIHLEHVSGMLATNTSLKTLILGDGQFHAEAYTRGYTSLAIALRSNQSLKTLRCRISSNMELKALLDPLMPLNNNPQYNTTLTSLVLEGKIGGKEGVQTLVEMLRTNTSLLDLKLFRVSELTYEDPHANEYTVAILEVLKTNKSLKKIDFSLCRGVGGYKVLGTMMDLLLENHCIEDILLGGTRLEELGDEKYVSSALAKKKKMNLWSIVQGMANVKPTSGRVFLCGEPYAGKTTLRMSMKQLKEFQSNVEIHTRLPLGKRIWTKLKGHKVPKVTKKKLPNERTCGIEVDDLTCNGISISIWDMAGQTDYHSFHELVMPSLSADGSCVLFLLMCNPMQQTSPWKERPPSNVKSEIESWLRFIASNTRRSHSYRPHVSIVMTHFDHWKNTTEYVDRIKDVVEELKAQFQEVLEFDDKKVVFMVDARDELDVEGMFNFMKSHLQELLGRMPKTISACDQVQHRIAQWNVDKSKQSVLQWNEFCESMCKDVKELNDVDEALAKRRKEFVAISLNDGGHIIYHEEGGVVITNPHWLCHDIMGQFLQQCAKKGRGLEMVSKNGIISIKHVKRFIWKLIEGQGDVEKLFLDILGIMKKLHVCYEQDGDHIMIPSTLEDNHQSLSWSHNFEATSFTCIGRRLACKDVIQTMLTPGFFTRLQVSFFNSHQDKNIQDTYELFRDVIKFISDGIEVIVQFNHGDIDIFLRSHQCQDIMLEFLEIRIVRHIKDVQQDPTLGCPGVLLEEYIFRPDCVKKLIDSKNRKDQCVSMEDLKLDVMRNSIVNATHNWKACDGLGIGCNKVKTLLGNKAWKQLLERRTCDLQRYKKEITLTSIVNQNDPSSCKEEKGGLWTDTSLFKDLHKRLFAPLDVKFDNLTKIQHEHHKEVMTKLDDVIQIMEQNIVTLQKNLLYEVCSRIDDLMEFSVNIHNSQIPKLAYLTEPRKKSLLTHFVPGLGKLQLHFMCESRIQFHNVEDQEGCMINLGTKDTRRFLTLLEWGLKITTMLTKIGAHVAAGMGGMVPDFTDGGRFAALILDTSGLLDHQSCAAKLESVPDDVKREPRITMDDKLDAEEWLIGFLMPLCKDLSKFYEMFKLKKVRYKSSSRSIAWICNACMKREGDEIERLY